jgi:hypothetical protein
LAIRSPQTEMDYEVTKSIIIAALLSAGLSISFAQPAAPDAAASKATAADSTPKKRKLFHAPKLRKGATAASNPTTTPFKQGGQ